jgi:hypothetical protein
MKIRFILASFLITASSGYAAKNDSPFAAWNSPIHKDSPFAPHNDAIRKDSPFEAWNRPTGRNDDLNKKDRKSYGLPTDD